MSSTRRTCAGCFEMGEALWALGHIKGMGSGPDDNALQRLRADAKQLSAESGSTLDDVLQRYKLSLQLIDVSSEIISEFDNTLKLVPASDWTRTLRGEPTGAVLPDRKIMILYKEGEPPRYYDVAEGRYLTKEESEGAR